MEWQEGFIADDEWEFPSESSVEYSEVEHVELCKMRKGM